MQRLTIQCEGEWSFDPDPEGEVVDADDAIELVKTLVKALKSARECIDAYVGRGPTYCEVNAAIAKAESTRHL